MRPTWAVRSRSPATARSRQSARQRCRAAQQQPAQIGEGFPFHRVHIAATEGGKPFCNNRRAMARHDARQADLVLQIVTDFVQDRAERPRIDQSVIRQLDQRKWIELLPQSPQRNAAPECRGEKPVRMYENGGGAGMDFATPRPRNVCW